MVIHEAKLSYNSEEKDISEYPILGRADLVANYMKEAFIQYPLQESFWIICVNQKNRVISRHMTSLGTANSTLAHPREIFRPAFLTNCTSIICAHNHPSGDLAPSGADITLTKILKEAGKILDIQLLDHVILGQIDCDPLNRGYYSFREAGII